MPKAHERIVVIGAGHNGLVAACYLAKAGFAPLVLEQRPALGGSAVTEELHPGFRCPTLVHAGGTLLPHIVHDLQLTKHGLAFAKRDARVFAPDLDGRAVTIYEDGERTARELSRLSANDSKSYREFHSSFARIGRVLAPLLSMTPPAIDNLTKTEMWDFGKLGLRFRGLGKTDAYRLLRWGPMAVADLATEWFESDLLRAMVAARGIHGTFAGPRSAGTSASLLLQAATDGNALAPSVEIQGGIGSLTDALALAARSGGAEIRTGVRVAQVRVSNGRAVSVILAGGEEIAAQAVVSNADPQNTFLRLVDPTELDPDFLMKVRNYRCIGSAAKVNLALSALPSFSGGVLSGRIHIGPSIEYIERAFDSAKYGDFSPQPYMDITIPSLNEPSLAPKDAHVMSIWVQYAPYKLKNGDWSSRRDEFGDAVIKTLSAYAPNLPQLIVHRTVLTPPDIEQTFGLSGGHVLHGEHILNQLFSFRPIPGWAQYRTPIQGLYLCSSGTHPGSWASGACGANASREILRDLRS